MREIRKIIVHCSDSDFGDAAVIDQWHKARKWKGIGYHFVITNGVIHAGDDYKAISDGVVQNGRPVEETGAHVKGHNADSIGICLIGRHHFTGRQLGKALPDLMRALMQVHSVPIDRVYGHRDFDPHKTCPNIETDVLRRILRP